MNAPTIHIIGCGACREDITAGAFEALRQCDVLYGGQRMLDWFGDLSAQKIPLTAALDQELKTLVEMSKESSVGILASGDSLFFGIANKLRSYAPGDRVQIHPGVSAMQIACARFQLTWDHARFFSIHGRDVALPWREILRSPMAVIYGDHQRPPNWIAAELIRSFPECATQTAYVAENLGAAEERTLNATLEQIAKATFSGLSMLIVEAAPSLQTPPLPLGLPDEAYEHEGNLITHPEVRAIAFAKLRLRRGAFWDLGAGSGSVGIEAAGLAPGIEVHSVEKNASRAAMIERNAATQGVDVTVWPSDIANALPQLPEPTAVFIGGGGKDVGAYVEAALNRLPPGGRLVATAILTATIETLSHTASDMRREWLEISVSRARPLAHSYIMEPNNPIHIFVFEKPNSI